jgi:hypothetical protein
MTQVEHTYWTNYIQKAQTHDELIVVLSVMNDKMKELNKEIKSNLKSQQNLTNLKRNIYQMSRDLLFEEETVAAE